MTKQIDTYHMTRRDFQTSRKKDKPFVRRYPNKKDIGRLTQNEIDTIKGKLPLTSTSRIRANNFKKFLNGKTDINEIINSNVTFVEKMTREDYKLIRQSVRYALRQTNLLEDCSHTPNFHPLPLHQG